MANAIYSKKKIKVYTRNQSLSCTLSPAKWKEVKGEDCEGAIKN